MKVEIIKTKESDGNWLKVQIDDKVYACFGIRDDEKEALRRATEVFDFIVECKGKFEVIKSVEV